MPPLVPSPAEKQYLASLPVLKVSTEPVWPPFDCTQTGEPRGYSVDIIRMIVRMTGLQVQFVIGYDWQEKDFFLPTRSMKSISASTCTRRLILARCKIKH